MSVVDESESVLLVCGEPLLAAGAASDTPRAVPALGGCALADVCAGARHALALSGEELHACMMWRLTSRCAPPCSPSPAHSLLLDSAKKKNLVRRL